MAPLHKRMPVILGRCDWPAWLDSKQHGGESLLKLIAPCPAESLQA